MGHVLSGQGVSPSKSKIQAILDIPTPEKKVTQRLLGMLTYLINSFFNRDLHFKALVGKGLWVLLAGISRDSMQ